MSAIGLVWDNLHTCRPGEGRDPYSTAGVIEDGVWIPDRVRCAHLAGTTRGRFVLLGRETSLHLFVGVDAPQPLLFDPAIEAVAGDTAPACRAPLDLGHDAGLQPG